MRNGSIALGLGLFVVAILAAEGKLGALWTAIMHADSGAVETVKGTVPATVGGAPVRADIVTGTPAFNGSKATSGIPLDTLTSRGAQNTTLYPVPLPGQNSAFDTVFGKWPAGYQDAWNSFLGCWQQNGSIETCRPFILDSTAKG